LNNTYKKFDSKMAFHEKFLSPHLWRLLLFLLSLANPKEGNGNLTTWDECPLSLLSPQKNSNFFFKKKPKMTLQN
jgi:hypothetical protein